jgi:hypothetical protein
MQRANTHSLAIELVEQRAEQRRWTLRRDQPRHQVALAVDGVSPSLDANQNPIEERLAQHLNLSSHP